MADDTLNVNGGAEMDKIDTPKRGARSITESPNNGKESDVPFEATDSTPPSGTEEHEKTPDDNPPEIEEETTPVTTATGGEAKAAAKGTGTATSTTDVATDVDNSADGGDANSKSKAAAANNTEVNPEQISAQNTELASENTQNFEDHSAQNAELSTKNTQTFDDNSNHDQKVDAKTGDQKTETTVDSALTGGNNSTEVSGVESKAESGIEGSGNSDNKNKNANETNVDSENKNVNDVDNENKNANDVSVDGVTSDSASAASNDGSGNSNVDSKNESLNILKTGDFEGKMVDNSKTSNEQAVGIEGVGNTTFDSVGNVDLENFGNNNIGLENIGNSASASNVSLENIGNPNINLQTGDVKVQTGDVKNDINVEVNIPEQKPVEQKPEVNNNYYNNNTTVIYQGEQKREEQKETPDAPSDDTPKTTPGTTPKQQRKDPSNNIPEKKDTEKDADGSTKSTEDTSKTEGTDTTETTETTTKETEKTTKTTTKETGKTEKTSTEANVDGGATKWEAVTYKQDSVSKFLQFSINFLKYELHFPIDKVAEKMGVTEEGLNAHGLVMPTDERRAAYEAGALTGSYAYAFYEKTGKVYDENVQENNNAIMSQSIEDAENDVNGISDDFKDKYSAESIHDDMYNTLKDIGNEKNVDAFKKTHTYLYSMTDEQIKAGGFTAEQLKWMQEQENKVMDQFVEDNVNGNSSVMTKSSGEIFKDAEEGANQYLGENNIHGEGAKHEYKRKKDEYVRENTISTYHILKDGFTNGGIVDLATKTSEAGVNGKEEIGKWDLDKWQSSYTGYEMKTERDLVAVITADDMKTLYSKIESLSQTTQLSGAIGQLHDSYEKYVIARENDNEEDMNKYLDEAKEAFADAIEDDNVKDDILDLVKDDKVFADRIKELTQEFGDIPGVADDEQQAPQDDAGATKEDDSSMGR